MMDSESSSLPRSVQAVIDEWIERSGARGTEAVRVREDLEQHFLDGLAAGRTAEALIQAFGDPQETAPLLRSSRSSSAPPQGASLPRWRAALDAVFADLRFALRTVRSTPLFALTIAVVLALGIGANALTFAIVNEVLLKPLPVSDQASLVNVLADVPGGNSFTGFSVGDYEDLRDDNDVLTHLVATSAVRVPLGKVPASERVVVSIVSAEYFRALGVGAAMGTVALPPFTGWDADPVVVVSHAFWQSRLGGAPDVVGSTLRVNGSAVTVLGVAAEGFSGTFIGFPTEIWTPLSMVGTYRAGFDPQDRSQKFLELLGRRRAGVSVAAADMGLDAVAADIERIFPDLNRNHRVRVVRLTGIDSSLRTGVLAFTAILTVVAGLVLLIACLNVGSILLVRTMSREREIAIRIAVGAGRRRLLVQMLMETAVVTAGATVLALGLAAYSTDVLRDFVSVISGGLGLELGLDWRVLALTVAAALAAALAASLVPSLHIAGRDPAAVLKVRGPGGQGASRMRGALVVAQVALSVVLAISSGLFVRALSEGLEANPGFDPDRVASLSLRFDPERFDAGTAAAMQAELLSQVRALPGIEGAAWSASEPVGVGRSPATVSVPGVDPPRGEPGHVVDARSVGSDYFATLGLAPWAGEPIGAAHDRAEPRLALVSQAFVERFLEGRAIVGRTIRVDGEEVRVIGVAPDVRYVIQDDTPDPLVYLSLGPVPRERLQLVFRAETDPIAFQQPIQRAVVGTLGGNPQIVVRSVRQTLSDALVPQRIGAAVIGAMGIIALVLASVGLYGLVQYTVSRDSRSLGIRMALGGRRTHIAGAVLRRGFLLAGLGLLVGGVAAVVLTPGLRPFLVGVPTWDPMTYGLVLGTFAIVALGASLSPALRASRIDPARTLRSD